MLGNLGIQNGDDWKRVAIPELQHALITDPTQADLIAMLVASDLVLNRTEEAQRYYDRFKIVAKRSPLLDMVKGAR